MNRTHSRGASHGHGPEDILTDRGREEGETMPLSPSSTVVKVHLSEDGYTSYGTMRGPTSTGDHDDRGAESAPLAKSGCGCCGRTLIRDSRESWTLAIGVVVGSCVAALAILVGIFFSGLDGGTAPSTGPPAAVTGCAVTSVTQSEAIVTFDTSSQSEPGLEAVTRYEAQQKMLTDPSEWTNVSLPGLGLSGSFSVGSLLGNTQYCWRVAAVNVAGPGPWSEAACERTKNATAPPRPLAPHQVFSDSQPGGDSEAVASTGELFVAWKTTQNTGGSPITRCTYVVLLCCFACTEVKCKVKGSRKEPCF